MFYMAVIERLSNLNQRVAALVKERLPESSRFFLSECARPNIDLATANQHKPGLAAEYHLAYAEPYVTFVERSEKHHAQFLEESLRRLRC